MPQHYRHYWGNTIANRFNFEWDAIQHYSYVVITAAEGPALGSSDFPPNDSSAMPAWLRGASRHTRAE